MDYKEIPKLTSVGGYEIHQSWRYLEDWITNHTNKGEGITSLDLEPDFQRGHVWKKSQQVAYVEYCLKGGAQNNKLLFNCVGWMGNFKGPFVIVDGKQRLEAVRKFLRDDLEVFGQKCSEFGKLPHEYHFVVNINNLKTREEVLQWYLEMNSGGTPHTKAELDKVRVLLQDSVLSGERSEP